MNTCLRKPLETKLDYTAQSQLSACIVLNIPITWPQIDTMSVLVCHVTYTNKVYNIL